MLVFLLMEFRSTDDIKVASQWTFEGKLKGHEGGTNMRVHRFTCAPWKSSILSQASSCSVCEFFTAMRTNERVRFLVFDARTAAGDARSARFSRLIEE